MITTNINGDAISQAFIDEIRSDAPRIIARLWYNGAELACDIVNITIEKGSCGSETFMLGDVIGDLLTATVKNLTASIKGQKIECHIGAWTGSDYEYISTGVFTVSDVKKTRYQSTITAYSGIVADSGDPFDTSGLASQSIINLAVRLQSDLGCTITFDAGIDTSPEITQSLEGLSDYQVLQIIATCCAGYAINDNQGNIRIKKFDAAPTLSVDTGMMVTLPEISEKPYKVRNVGVLVSEDTVDNEGNEVPAVYYVLESQAYLRVLRQGTDYYLVDENENRIIVNIRPEIADLYFTCEYMTQEIYTENIRKIVGYEYYPADVGLTLGDPRLEGSDVLAVTDIDGRIYNVPCHQLTHTYTGGFTSQIQSADGTETENDIGTTYPITEKLQALSRQTGTAQATAENAYQIAGTTKQYFWFLEEMPPDIDEKISTGAHITEVPQADFIDPDSLYYCTGGNLLARSNGIAVRNGLEELAIFGESVRIGSSSSSMLFLTDSGIQADSQDGTTYFLINSTGASISQRISDGGNQEIASGSSYQFAVTYLLTDKFSRWPDMPAGTRLYVKSLFTFKARSSGTTPQEMTFGGSFTLLKGTSEDQTFYNTRFSVRYTYDPDTEQVAIILSAQGTFADAYYPSIIDYEDFVTVVTAAPTYRFGVNLPFTGQPVSTAFGDGTIPGAYAVALGKYNEEDTDNSYALMIGNGTADDDRANAFTVDWSGDLTIAGQHQELFKITTLAVETGNIEADSYKAGQNYTMTEESGYNAVGIVGWSTTNWRIQPTSHYIASNTQLFSGFANYKAPPASGTVPTASATITFRILWLKATSAV